MTMESRILKFLHYTQWKVNRQTEATGVPSAFVKVQP